MAKLRDKYRDNNTGELLPLDTKHTDLRETNIFSSQTSGTNSSKQIRIIPYGEFATTQSLLLVAEDLIENDRRINNEKNAMHSLLSEGILNDPGNNFILDINFETNVYKKLKSLELSGGRAKADGNIHEIIGSNIFLFTDSEEEGRKVIEKFDGELDELTPYRRDYISIVYQDDDPNIDVGNVPYIRYVNGSITSTAQPKHYQKFYNADYPHDIKTVGGNDYAYKEFILYSICYYYNTEGQWNKIPSYNSIEEISDVFEYDGNEYAEINEKLYKKESGSWIEIDDPNNELTIESPYLPPYNSYDHDKFVYIPEEFENLETGWYKKVADNNYTEIKLVDLIAEYSGIADIIHFQSQDLKIYENPDFTLLRPSSLDRQFYHPYSNFKTLEFNYGQGDALPFVGDNFEIDDEEYKYSTTDLNINFIDLNHKNSSLYNFPLFIPQTDEMELISGDESYLDHILLGYQKSGYWNGDFIRKGNNIYRLIENEWINVNDLIDLKTSFIPSRIESVEELDYDFLLVDDNFYKLTETVVFEPEEEKVEVSLSWSNSLQESYETYSSLPNSGTANEIIFITGADGIDSKGWYQFDINNGGFWKKIKVETADKLIDYDKESEDYLFKNDIFIYCDGSNEYSNGYKENIYKYKTDIWENLIYTVVETDEDELIQLLEEKFPHAVNNKYVKIYQSIYESEEEEPTEILTKYFKYNEGSWIEISQEKIITEDDERFNQEVFEETGFPFSPDTIKYIPVENADDIPRVLNTEFNSNERVYIEGGEEDIALDFVLVYNNENEEELYIWNFESESESESDGEYISFENIMESEESIYYVKKSLPYITQHITENDYYYIWADGISKLYKVIFPSIAESESESEEHIFNPATYENHGVFFKSENIYNPDFPKFGWYRYNYFAQTWESLFVNEGQFLPEYNLIDKTYFEIGGNLYFYDANLNFWKEIDVDPLDYLPEENNINDYYVDVYTFDANVDKGLYIYKQNNWQEYQLGIETGFPKREDNIEIELIKPNVYKNPVGDQSIFELENVDLIDSNKGEYKLILNIPTNQYNFYLNINDCIIVSEGIGKYQTGIITNIEEDNKTITVERLFTEIDNNCKVEFYKSDNFQIIDTSMITKNDIMHQIDDIENFIPENQLDINPFLFPKKFNNEYNYYEIKFDLDNEKIINKEEWYIIRVKASKEDETYQMPAIVVADKTKSMHERNGYFSIRIAGKDGLYPYYGKNLFGNIDKTIKYFVIEDYYNKERIGEIQDLENNTVRMNYANVNKYNIIAMNLDDVNAKRLYKLLENTTQIDNIYIDVFNGRIMAHPFIINRLKNTEYEFKISFIILNVLKGYISTENIIHDKSAEEKIILDDYLKEQNKHISDLFYEADYRKIFKYRTSIFNPIIHNNSKISLLYGITEDDLINPEILTEEQYEEALLNSKLYFVDGTEDELDPNDNHKHIYDISFVEQHENKLSRFTFGDELTNDLHIYNEGFYKDGDCFQDVSGKWYKSISNEWIEIDVEVVYSLPEIESESETEYEIDDFVQLIEDNTFEGIYQFDGTDWIKQDLAITKNNNIPEKEYTLLETNITDDFETIFSFNSIKNLEDIKFVGIRLSDLGSDWQSLSLRITSQISHGEDFKTFEYVENLFNSKISIEDKYIYFDVSGDYNDLTSEGEPIQYNVQVRYNGTATTPPILLGSDEFGHFVKVLCTFKHQENSNIFFNILNKTSLLPLEIWNEDVDEIDETTNLPTIEFKNNLLIPVDFSDDYLWSNWNYGNCIGYDPRLGRIKLPTSLDGNNHTYEFNVNWNTRYLNTKGVSTSFNKNVSIEDYLDILNFKADQSILENYINEKIFKYSPTENIFFCQGNPNQSFILDFVPMGFAKDEDGNLIEVEGEYLGNNTAKKSLLVRINQTILDHNEFSLDGKNLILNENIRNELVYGDIIVVKGSEYRVLNTVANRSISPDHFDENTQKLIQELRKIRDVDFDDKIELAKGELETYILEELSNYINPQENIFKIDENELLYRKKEDDTWEELGNYNNLLKLTWKVKDVKSVLVIINNVIQSTQTYSLIHSDSDGDEINILSPVDFVEGGDTYITIKGNIIKPIYNPSNYYEPIETVYDDITEEQTYFDSGTFFPDEKKGYFNVFLNGLYNHKFTVENITDPGIYIFGYNDLYNFDLFDTPIISTAEFESESEILNSIQNSIKYNNILYGYGNITSGDFYFKLEDDIIEIIDAPVSDPEVFDDWFLPSKDELDAMYVNLHLEGVGGFAYDNYWSSSENDDIGAWYKSFDFGSQVSLSKDFPIRVRAVRAFTDSTIYQLRDTGPAGGLIFHIDGDTKYEASPEDYTEGGTETFAWSNIDDVEIGTTGTEIGTGKQNTLDIINQDGHTDSAALKTEELELELENEGIVNFNNPIVYDNKIFFEGEGELSGDKEICYIDFEEESEVEIPIIKTINTTITEFKNPIIFNNNLYFVGKDGATTKLYKIIEELDESESDLLVINVEEIIAEIESETITSFSNFIIYNNRLYFEGELDGTLTPIYMNDVEHFIKTIDATEGIYISEFKNPSVFNTRIYFQGMNNNSNKQLFEIHSDNQIHIYGI